VLSHNGKEVEMAKRARYLQSIACLVKDSEKHDELRRKAQALLTESNMGGTGNGS
jgi:hypothetical protein